MEMNSDHLHDLFARVDYVNSICFTGGEPSLAPNVIKETLRIAELYDTTISNFYIATNAMVVPDEFLSAIMDLWLYCDDNECSAVHYSNDKYHDKMPTENVDKLRTFRFVEAKYPKDGYSNLHLINEGNAVTNGIGRRDHGSASFEIDDGNVSDGEVYLNCLGNIIAGCDWSYETQDAPERIVCHVSELTLDKLEEFIDE